MSDYNSWTPRPICLKINIGKLGRTTGMSASRGAGPRPPPYAGYPCGGTHIKNTFLINYTAFSENISLISLFITLQYLLFLNIDILKETFPSLFFTYWSSHRSLFLIFVTETISRTDKGQPRQKYIFNKLFFTLQRFGPSPSPKFTLRGSVWWVHLRKLHE